MAQAPILTHDEAKEFLTKADLEKLIEQVEQGQLAVYVDTNTIVVRGKEIRLFDALELMGTL